MTMIMSSSTCQTDVSTLLLAVQLFSNYEFAVLFVEHGAFEHATAQISFPDKCFRIVGGELLKTK